MSRLLRLSFSFTRATAHRRLFMTRHSNPQFQRTAFLRPSRFLSAGGDFTETVPPLGDSISNATVASLLKNVGDYVQEKEIVAVFETDKVSVDIRASKSGQIKSMLAKTGDLLNVGQDFFVIDTSVSAPAGGASASAPKAEKPKESAVAAPKKEESAPSKKEASAPASKPAEPAAVPVVPKAGSRNETSVPLKPMRLTIAKRLKESQNTAAMLTTFNEVDMHNITNLRAKFKDEFESVHGIKLGFMSAFVKASAQALVKSPVINAMFDMEKSCITYRDYVDISVAVSTPTGLVVPVLRDCQNMSFADIEKAIALLGKRAREKLITKDEMTGGTFTISNGGVYGSLMGTPIINAPQSAILGMHGIFKRPVAIDDQVVIRPMMYIALSYDHRLIDGKDAVLFLKDIKNNIEDPSRLLLDL